MTAFDQISLIFVGVCAAVVAYLVLIEPVRDWLGERKHKKKKRK